MFENSPCPRLVQHTDLGSKLGGREVRPRYSTSEGVEPQSAQGTSCIPGGAGRAAPADRPEASTLLTLPPFESLRDAERESKRELSRREAGAATSARAARASVFRFHQARHVRLELVVKFQSPAARIPASTPGSRGQLSPPINTAIKARFRTAPAAEKPRKARNRRKSASALGSRARASGNVTTSFQTKLLRMASATPASAASESLLWRNSISQRSATKFTAAPVRPTASYSTTRTPSRVSSEIPTRRATYFSTTPPPSFLSPSARSSKMNGTSSTRR